MVLALMLWLFPAAEPDAPPLAAAEASFRAGMAARAQTAGGQVDFARAADLFAEVRMSGVRNPLLDRNEGNARLLAGDLAAALACYRRAVESDPSDPTARRLLAWSREQVDYDRSTGFGRPPDVPGGDTWLTSARTVRIILVTVFQVLGSLAVIRWLVTSRREWLVGGLASLVVGMAMGLWWAFTTGEDDPARAPPWAVMARDGVYLRSGNGNLYPTRFGRPTARGMEVLVLARRGDWSQVELSGGEVGWVPSAGLIPGSRSPGQAEPQVPRSE